MGYYRYRLKLKLKDFLFRLTKKEEPKIFCISFQRTGTTSTGKFFKNHGYRVAISNVNKINRWTEKYIKGDYEAIFNSAAFKANRVFEDAPWWCGDFYKILFNRFPRAKFILLERDADDWFNSMMNHSGQKNPGNTFRHSKTYRRQQEYYKLGLGEDHLYSNEVDNLLPLTEEYRDHYIEIYKLRNREVKEYFETFDRERLFCGKLKDEHLWENLGEFCGIEVKPGYSVHANKTAKQT